MATANVSKASKWFSNKSLRLSLHRRGSKSSSSLSSPRSSPTPPHGTPKRSKKEDELKEVFRYFDGDGDGKISALELRAYFGSIGEYLSHEDAQGVINDLDSDGDSMLDYQDFLKLMKREGSDDDLKEAFEMFELEKGSGCITPKGLQRMLNRLGDAKSYDECVAMIQAYDIDGNGVLDFYEFHQMMA
ncbi:probable calcium-binding protein CML41 [Durio zibethinus]|uniref:Probable calcium-binding protein CML41 n=1 Tax=Durio zibethinus TaxID=66656 RepID=A0A6P5ZI34_DURZI|nr:probable calcium-binding protein CML41 [Durio zibethinus]